MAGVESDAKHLIENPSDGCIKYILGMIIKGMMLMADNAVEATNEEDINLRDELINSSILAAFSMCRLEVGYFDEIMTKDRASVYLEGILPKICIQNGSQINISL